MRNLVARVLAMVACASVLSLAFGPGMASADAWTGKTYSDVVAQISKQRGTPVVATVSGSVLELDDCIVTSWQQSIFLGTDGTNSRPREYRLNLNCNNAVATPGHPGNSVMTPVGAKAKEDQTNAANINNDPGWCKKSEERMAYCVRLCDRTGLCEVEA